MNENFRQKHLVPNEKHSAEEGPSLENPNPSVVPAVEAPEGSSLMGKTIQQTKSSHCKKQRHRRNAMTQPPTLNWIQLHPFLIQTIWSSPDQMLIK
jgi:hypothetical protein